MFTDRKQELPFDDSIKFFPNYSDIDKMLAYAILGGNPLYLRQFKPNLTLNENTLKYILTKGCNLYSEVGFLLKQKLKDPKPYNTILETIALGSTTLNDICTKTKMGKTKISLYLKTLIKLEIVEHEFPMPINTKTQTNSEKGLYHIKNNFFRFWFYFASPHMADLETGNSAKVLEHIVLPQLDSFTAPVFENVCREYLLELNRNNKLSFNIAKLGKWWGTLDGAQTKIDIVAKDAMSKTYILGKCTFQNTKMNINDLEILKTKAELIEKSANIQYILFSKSGFSENLVSETAKDDRLTLLSLTRMN